MHFFWRQQIYRLNSNEVVVVVIMMTIECLGGGDSVESKEENSQKQYVLLKWFYVFCGKSDIKILYNICKQIRLSVLVLKKIRKKE